MPRTRRHAHDLGERRVAEPARVVDSHVTDGAPVPFEELGRVGEVDAGIEPDVHVARYTATRMRSPSSSHRWRSRSRARHITQQSMDPVRSEVDRSKKLCGEVLTVPLQDESSRAFPAGNIALREHLSATPGVETWHEVLDWFRVAERLTTCAELSCTDVEQQERQCEEWKQALLEKGTSGVPSLAGGGFDYVPTSAGTDVDQRDLFPAAFLAFGPQSSSTDDGHGWDAAGFSHIAADVPFLFLTGSRDYAVDVPACERPQAYFAGGANGKLLHYIIGATHASIPLNDEDD